MSVRATERLVGDIVIVSNIPNSPLMVVQAVDMEAKMVETTWFSDGNECQEGIFPASSLDRAEDKKSANKPAAKKPASASKPKAKK